MKNKDMLLNSLLAGILGIGLLAAMICRTFQPYIVLPKLNIPSMAGIMLIALVLEYYITSEMKRFWVVQSLLAGITFVLLPLAAGIISAGEAGLLFFSAAMLFLSLLFVFTAITKRMNATLVPKTAVIPIAFGMFLACQSFAGIII